MNSFVQQVTELQKPIASRLGSLDMELTERCNNDCIHCCINLPVNDRAAKAREMTTDQVKAILKEAADLGCLRVRFTGGEPLLRSDFEALYLYARRLGIKVLLFTNARLITPQLADLFAHIPPLVTIEITVYGMHKESYEAVTRVPGSFAQFRRGVDLLLDRKVPFVVKAALLPPNRHEMEELETWVATIPWMDHPPGYAMTFDPRNRRDDADRNTLITSLRLTPEEAVAVLTRDPDKYRREMEAFSSKFMGPAGDVLFGWSPALTVDLIGGGDGPLRAALDVFSRLPEMRATNPEYLERCAVCFLKGLCEQCPAKSWAEHGTLDTPVEYLCAVAHAQARWLGWLAEGERAWEVSDWRERIKGSENQNPKDADSFRISKT